MGKLQELVAALLIAVFVIGIPVGATLAKNAFKDPQTIDIVIRQYEAGGFSRKTIRVKEGQPVRLRLISEDVTHGFIIGELGVDAGIIKPGKPVTVEFVPERKGEFSYVCSVVCSPAHPKLRGKLIVE
ncbi:MAG TPA: hypothetical protein GXX34_05055 [Clostridia bacterium]|nr:hypothetical protein [Clostridia bacterium]